MRKALVLSSLVLLGACASPTYTLSVVPVGNQTAIMRQGAASVVSAWQGSTVVVNPVDADLEGNLALYVTVTNNSGAAANFGTENIAVSYDGQTWLSAKTYEELKNSLDNRALGAKIGVALLTGLAAAAANANATYTGHGTVYTPYGTSSYSYTGVDPVARQIGQNAAYAQGADAMAQISAAHDQGVARLRAEALRTSTVGPAQMFGGLVVAAEPSLDSDRATPVLVRVTFQNDVHVLQFQAHRPGVVAAPAIDVSGSPALALEASHNIAPDSDSTPVTAAPTGGMPLAMSDVVTASAAPAQPACTDADRDMAKLARKNGFAYHGACGM